MLKSGSTRPDNVAVKLGRTFAAVNLYDGVLIPASLLLKATAPSGRAVRCRVGNTTS